MAYIIAFGCRDTLRAALPMIANCKKNMTPT